MAFTSESWVHTLDPCPSVLTKQNKVRGVVGVHVESLLGGGDEVFDRTIVEVKYDFGFGACGVGSMVIQRRQLTQLANHAVMIDVEHCKHELQQMSDKLKSARLFSANDMTRHHVGYLPNMGCKVKIRSAPTNQTMQHMPMLKQEHHKKLLRSWLFAET